MPKGAIYAIGRIKFILPIAVFLSRSSEFQPYNTHEDEQCEEHPEQRCRVVEEGNAQQESAHCAYARPHDVCRAHWYRALCQVQEHAAQRHADDGKRDVGPEPLGVQPR